MQETELHHSVKQLNLASQHFQLFGNAYGSIVARLVDFVRGNGMAWRFVVLLPTDVAID